MDFHTTATDKLFTAIALLNSKEECEAFFDDLCTIKEILDMAQRFEAADMLNQGCNYQTITKSAGLSAATISRVSRSLNYGTGGYKTAIERYREMQDKNEN